MCVLVGRICAWTGCELKTKRINSFGIFVIIQWRIQEFWTRSASYRYMYQDRMCHTSLGVKDTGCHWPFDAHCCHIRTSTKHPEPDRVKPLSVIFDIRALWCSAMSVRVPGCQKLQMTMWCLVTDWVCDFRSQCSKLITGSGNVILRWKANCGLEWQLYVFNVCETMRHQFVFGIYGGVDHGLSWIHQSNRNLLIRLVYKTIRLGSKRT